MLAVSRPCLAWLGILALFVSFPGPSNSTRAAQASTSPDRLEFQQLLREHRFDEIESRLADYDHAYRAGDISDHILEQAYNAFAGTVPDMEANLTRWIASRPESHAARMARGIYYQHLALVALDSRATASAADENHKSMLANISLARADIMAALEINPGLSVAYGSLILFAMVRGDGDAADSAVRAGLKVDPRSFVIRRRYLYSLTPWWRRHPAAWGDFRALLRAWLGGRGRLEAPGAVRRFVTEIERDAVDNPALAPLTGFGDFVVAEMLARQRRKEEAAEFYERSLRFGDYWLYLFEQGTNLHRLKRYDEAIVSQSRALKAWPQHPHVLNWRARSSRQLKQYDRAFDDWDLALALDPQNPTILVRVAYALRDLKRYSDVLSILDRAMTYGANDEDVRDARGRILLYELNRPADAIADLRAATAIDPESKKYWFNYGLALYRTKDCKAMEAVATYRRLCEAGAKCVTKNIDWAERAVDVMTDPAICPPQDDE